MQWDSLGAWLYKDGEPDYAKMSAHGIKTIYLDPHSANAAALIADLRGHGIQAGIYYATSWLPGATPVQFVNAVHAQVKRLIPQAYPLSSQTMGAPVMLDLEAVSKDWQDAVCVEYRRQMPSRETAYTNEPFKDGTVVPVSRLLQAQFHWYVQLYRGDMSPVDAAAAIIEPARWGFLASMTHPFYDGARLPDDHRDGCVFTLERLP